MIDWYERKSSYVLVMERPERHIDLFDYLNQAGPIREPVVRDIFIQVTNTRLRQNETLFFSDPRINYPLPQQRSSA